METGSSKFGGRWIEGEGGSENSKGGFPGHRNLIATRQQQTSLRAPIAHQDASWVPRINFYADAVFVTRTRPAPTLHDRANDLLEIP